MGKSTVSRALQLYLKTDDAGIKLGTDVKQGTINSVPDFFRNLSKHGIIMPTLASFAIICASLFNFLRFNHYPFLRIEVGLVVTSLLALTFVIGILYQGQQRVGKAILEGLLVFLMLDQNGAGAPYSALAAAAISAIVLLKPISSLPFLGVAAVATIGLGLVGLGESAAEEHNSRDKRIPLTKRATSKTLPALLHIILDEHIGIEGFPADNPQSATMKNTLTTFYLSHGFRLFGRAYSEHFHTVNSIPQMLNFGHSQPPGPAPTEGTVMSTNAYFDLLRKRGYRLHIRQSDFIDYCQNAKAVACHQYDSASLAPVANLPLSITERAGLIGVRFFLLSKTAEKLGNIYSFAAYNLGFEMPGFGLALAGRVSSVNALGAFDDLIKELEQARSGDAYFAHILLPHYPHATTANCAVRNVDEWMLRRSKIARRQRENAYFDQILCATKKLESALQALERSPAGQNFVVIVHGDHGSRITKMEPIVENIGKIDDEDIIAGFSTLFAVRGNGIESGYVGDPSSVPTLLHDFSRNGFRVSPKPYQPPRPIVYLDNNQWIPIRSHSLPEKWGSRPSILESTQIVNH